MSRHAEWVDRDLYPFRSNRLDLPAGRLHYIDEGEGPPVVMVHGNPTWSFLYRGLVKRLAPRHRCVVPDHLGFGLSDVPRGAAPHPREHAANLARLVQTLGLRDITLVVQDWGGPIGLSYAVEHPANVSRLIILNTWCWPVADDWYYRAFSGMVGGPIGRSLIRRANLFARVVMPAAYGDRRILTKRIHEQYLRPLSTPEERSACAALPGQIVGATAWLHALWSRFEALQEKPALIVWGMKDIAFRERELERWMEALPEARVVKLGEVGHYVQEEAPDELGDEAARFLADV